MQLTGKSSPPCKGWSSEQPQARRSPLSLSPTAVLAHQRLIRDGYILGFEARLNPAKLDSGMTVFVGCCSIAPRRTS